MSKKPSHPLFKTGVLHFSHPAPQKPSPVGYYNPVIDSIFMTDFNVDILWHEITHRTMSLTDGTTALRTLAALSHALIDHLLDIAESSNIKFSGMTIVIPKVKTTGMGK